MGVGVGGDDMIWENFREWVGGDISNFYVYVLLDWKGHGIRWPDLMCTSDEREHSAKSHHHARHSQTLQWPNNGPTASDTL